MGAARKCSQSTSNSSRSSSSGESANDSVIFGSSREFHSYSNCCDEPVGALGTFGSINRDPSVYEQPALHDDSIIHFGGSDGSNQY